MGRSRPSKATYAVIDLAALPVTIQFSENRDAEDANII